MFDHWAHFLCQEMILFILLISHKVNLTFDCFRILLLGNICVYGAINVWNESLWIAVFHENL